MWQPTAGPCGYWWRNSLPCTARAGKASRRRCPICRSSMRTMRSGNDTGWKPANASASWSTGWRGWAEGRACSNCRRTASARRCRATVARAMNCSCRRRWADSCRRWRSAKGRRCSCSCWPRSRRSCIATAARTRSASACRWPTATGSRPSGSSASSSIPRCCAPILMRRCRSLTFYSRPVSPRSAPSHIRTCRSSNWSRLCNRSAVLATARCSRPCTTTRTWVPQVASRWRRSCRG
ncbi:Uncharacterised protein [Pseudomonas aeruginosa]|nr:Uncharacterised protein [Pseudomonas aeruginosa]